MRSAKELHVYICQIVRGAPAVRRHEGLYLFLPYEVRVGHRRDRRVSPECVLVQREKAMGGPTCPWEPVEKSSSNTPVATRILRIFFLFFIIHSFLSLSSFSSFPFFSSHVLTRRFLVFRNGKPSRVLIDFTVLWKSLELNGLKENR